MPRLCLWPWALLGLLVQAAAVAVRLEAAKTRQANPAGQVHLALGDTADSAVVTWSCPFPRSLSAVQYRECAGSRTPHAIAADAMVAVGRQHKFVDNGTLHHTQYIHRVTLPDLKPAAKYCYQVADSTSATAWGVEYSFNTLRSFDASWDNPRFTVLGDMGLLNPRSQPALTKEVEEFRTDLLVHNGDLAYDLYRYNGTWGDRWLDSVQEIAATQYYMTSIGNHEPIYDAINYRSRFSMPMGWSDPERVKAGTQNLWYSFDVGNTHWVAYDVEVYFTYESMTGHGGVHRNFGPYPELQQAQLEWLEKDLKEASSRTPKPWIFAYGHRPMYCSDSDDSDCTSSNNGWKDQGIEQLFAEAKVDIVFEAHQHTYERLWPTYNGTVMNGTTVPGQPYTDAPGIVHVVTGAAGCEENLDKFDDGPLGDWSAIRRAAYGYGHLDVMNNTHARWRQLNYTGHGIIDEIWVIKNDRA